MRSGDQNGSSESVQTTKIGLSLKKVLLKPTERPTVFLSVSNTEAWFDTRHDFSVNFSLNN